MKIAKVHRKPVSMFVIIAFTIMLCYWANQTPAAPAVPAPEKSSTMSPANDESESPGFIEQEEPAHAYKKGKKFPWLIVALVVIAGGAAVYFLVVKKKNYTLTVTVGEGVSGTPAAGSSSNKKGTVVNYDYALQSGYSDLSVTLDGASVAASGTVTMNADHTLEAKATKTFILTVSRGEHVSGTPASGSYTHARGSNVAYSYAPASGYSNLEVKLDNVLVANSGTVAMDNNHTLTATLKGANLEVNSTPAGARIYLDNVDSGHNTPYSFNFSTAVTNKAVHLRYSCGYKEKRQTISVALGQTKTINATLLPGIWEEFLIPASSCWHPYSPSRWTSLLELYRYIGAASQWDTNSYYHSFAGDYTVSVHMNRKKGNTYSSNSIFLGTGTSMTNASGYIFQYVCDGQYSVYRFANRNYITNSGGSITTLKSWTSSSAIHTGLNQFNIMKVVKSGTAYDFYINGTLVTSVTDATYNPGYLSLLFYVGGTQTEIQYNYVVLTPGGTVAMPASSLSLDAGPTIDGDSTGTGPLIRK
jgi:hypothetical protein